MKIRDLAPFTIRIPPELKERIKKAADEKLAGSINSEIVKRLSDSFEVHDDIKKSLSLIREAYEDKTKTAAQELTDGELIDEIVRRWGPDAIAVKVSPKGDDQK